MHKTGVRDMVSGRGYKQKIIQFYTYDTMLPPSAPPFSGGDSESLDY
jgi:hypothetical protein